MQGSPAAGLLGRISRGSLRQMHCEDVPSAAQVLEGEAAFSKLVDVSVLQGFSIDRLMCRYITKVSTLFMHSSLMKVSRGFGLRGFRAQETPTFYYTISA